MDDGHGALVQLRAYIAQEELGANDRLPSERRLCELLGVRRSELRKAFAILESEGAVWRHVGRGTFIGDGVADPGTGQLAGVAKRTPPREVLQARLLLEPVLAREAALHATTEQLDALRDTAQRMRGAATWREYETLDNHFHRQVAAAAANTPMLALFDQLNALRRMVAWGRLRSRAAVPPPDHHSFAEHDALLDAIGERDGAGAEARMREHLRSVTALLFGV